MRVTAEHVRRVRRCAQVLAADQDVDGGWGLTRGQPPSLVNTAEVLMVLHAAQHAGPAIESGLMYLTRNVADHCSPRVAGGRGEKTRYVAFTLWALAECSQDSVYGFADVIAWILGWLEEHRQEDGWSEEAGILDCSLLETALIARGLGILLRRAKQGELTVPDGCRQRAHELLTVAVGGLLTHKLPRGWPQRVYTSRHSPAKTAWCLLGLAEAAQVHTPASTAQTRLDDVVRDGVHDLATRWADWRRNVEADPDVVAAVWSHLAYLLCLEAITTGGGDATATWLRPAWNDLNEAWSETHGHWLELTQPATPTVRATCYSVLAMEALRRQYGEHGLAAVTHEHTGKSAGVEDLWELRADKSGEYTLVRDGTNHLLVLSSAQHHLLAALTVADGIPAVVPSDHLATALGLVVASLGVTVSRLNAAVAEQIPKLGRRLVVAERGSGYKLNVTRITRH